MCPHQNVIRINNTTSTTTTTTTITTTNIGAMANTTINLFNLVLPQLKGPALQIYHFL